MSQLSIFDHSDYLDSLSKHKDPLEKLDATFDWEVFRPILDRLLKKIASQTLVARLMTP